VKFSAAFVGADGECGLWVDILQPAGAEVVASYTAGEHAGKAAVTINSFGKGKAVYVGADLDGASLARVLRTLRTSAGVQPAIEVPAGVEMTARRAGNSEWIFLLNNTSVAQAVTIPKPFTDLLTKESHSGTVELSGYGVRVLT